MTNFSKKFIICSLLFFLGSTNKTQAQLNGLDQEIGVIVGPLAFFSDYGLRYNVRTNTGNRGYGIGLVHYIRFALNDACGWNTSNPYINDHFKFRTEFDYHKTDLNHYGPLANKDNETGRRLRAMKGTAEVYELGGHIEYYPFSIRDFTEFAFPFAPFFSLGASAVRYDPDTTHEELYEKFVGGVDDDPGATWSISLGGGVRYKLTWKSDLLLSGQWKHYGSDWIDGLNHNNPENKANDTIFWLNFGYVYYLDF